MTEQLSLLAYELAPANAVEPVARKVYADLACGCQLVVFPREINRFGTLRWHVKTYCQRTHHQGERTLFAEYEAWVDRFQANESAEGGIR